jgi:ribosomal protein L37AE/L43A
MAGIDLSFSLSENDKLLAKLNWRKENDYRCTTCNETPRVQPGAQMAWCCWKCGFGTIHPSKFFKLARDLSPAF